MKQTILAILLLGSLIGGATVFGLTRSQSSGKASEEVESRLQLADRLLESDPSRAIKVLDELAAQGTRESEASRLIRIKALDKAGSHAPAAEAAAAFLKDFPKSESRDAVDLIRISNSLAAGGTTAETVRGEAEKVASSNPGSPEAQRIQLTLARKELAAGNLAEAQARMKPILETARLDDPEVFAAAEALGQANLESFFANAGPSDTTHEVRSGESVNAIARRNGLTDELLLKVNNITDPRRLRVGQKLRVPKVDFTLHVSRTYNKMVLKNNGEFFKIYNVRTGREEDATPVGTFRVLNKKRNPTWRPGNGDVYGPGDPNNELGTRWMAFEGDILGIHGTLHPETLGHYASNGCVGLSTPEVEELFDLITTGTTLIIEGERDLERHRVIPAPPLQPPQQVASNQ